MATRRRTSKRKITDPELIARLERNRVVIDEWLEMKVYSLPLGSFDRIRDSILGFNTRLTTREKFIRDLSLSYYRKFGEFPNIFRY